VTLVAERAERLNDITLKEGSSDENDRAMCVMEAVAYVAGEPWSDHPSCACPVITAFMVSWNDGLPSNADRDRLLRPLVLKLVETRGSDALANRRATMAADWMVRVYTPAWLRLAGLTAQADALASLPEIIDFANAPSLRGPLEAARRDAAAAGAAAWDAAWAAAGAAAWDAAWDAAGAAARAAARAAAWDVLKPTVEALQVSAVDLVERMIAVPEPREADHGR